MIYIYISLSHIFLYNDFKSQLFPGTDAAIGTFLSNQVTEAKY